MPKATVVPPEIPSGFARRKNAIFGGFTLLTVVYLLIFFLFKESSTFRAAETFCQDEEACTRSDLFGFQVSSGIMQLFMGTTGFLAWHWTKRAHSAIPPTPEGRLFGYLEEADRLNAGILVFQTWDFFFSLLIPEHRTMVFLTHHFLAGLTAWFSLEYQFFNHYAIFFGGCSEISTIFLVFCDFDVFFPAGRGSVWGTFILFCQASFTVAFFYYRIVGWCIVSYRMWSDVLYARKNNLAEQYRPGKAWFLYVFLFMDVVLGGLQAYWFGFGILPKILEILNAQ
jgi:hypothetical protein